VQVAAHTFAEWKYNTFSQAVASRLLHDSKRKLVLPVHDKVIKLSFISSLGYFFVWEILPEHFDELLVWCYHLCEIIVNPLNFNLLKIRHGVERSDGLRDLLWTGCFLSLRSAANGVKLFIPFLLFQCPSRETFRFCFFNFKLITLTLHFFSRNIFFFCVLIHATLLIFLEINMPFLDGILWKSFSLRIKRLFLI
jgi:hypothetical protein